MCEPLPRVSKVMPGGPVFMKPMLQKNPEKLFEVARSLELLFETLESPFNAAKPLKTYEI